MDEKTKRFHDLVSKNMTEILDSVNEKDGFTMFSIAGSDEGFSVSLLGKKRDIVGMLASAINGNKELLWMRSYCYSQTIMDAIRGEMDDKTKALLVDALMSKTYEKKVSHEGSSTGDSAADALEGLISKADA